MIAKTIDGDGLVDLETGIEVDRDDARDFQDDERCEGCGAPPGDECDENCPRERDLMDDQYPLSRGD